MDCEVTVVVDAEPGPAWERWTDFPGWSDWNAACVSAEVPRLEPGERLDLHLRHPRGRDFYTRPRLTRVERPSRISWEARALGLRAETDVNLTPEDGGTRVTLTSRSTGALSFTYRLAMRPHVQAEMYRTMLDGLAGSFQP